MGRIPRVFVENPPRTAQPRLEAALAIDKRLADAHPAVTVYQRDLATSHNNLGNLLLATGDPAGARASYEAALAIRRRLADAHPAVTDYQQDLAVSHLNLGALLARTGDPAGARASYEAALAIRRRLAGAHPESHKFASDLGGTLNNLATLDNAAGKFAAAADRVREAIAWQKKALAAYPRHPTYRQFLRNHYTNLLAAARGLDDAVLAAEARSGLAELDATDPRTAALDARLAALRRGAPPKDDAERLALAQRACDTQRYAEAARLWAEALASDPKLAADRRARHRYNAACAAALAAAGRDQDDPKPDDAARAELRRRALGWLKAELAAWSRSLDSADPKARAAVAATLRHWRDDPDLAGVRDADALAALPEAERDGWRALWAEVDRLLKDAGKAP
jgi:tetratricopeptide (TPR) repeat protein